MQLNTALDLYLRNIVLPFLGLSLVLFVDSNDYMPSSVTQTIGARLAIHPSDVSPLMSEAGLEISTASLNSISISEVRTLPDGQVGVAEGYGRYSYRQVNP